MIDTGLDETQVEAIRQTLAVTPGVLGVHDLRTRRMAHQALVDAHVQVDARISVSEGHRIAESARVRVLSEHPGVLDVLVHIDPEDDIDPDLAAIRLPAREVLLQELIPILADLPEPERVVLHYLGGRVEIELFFCHALFASPEDMQKMAAQLAERLEAHPVIGRFSVNYLSAPP